FLSLFYGRHANDTSEISNIYTSCDRTPLSIGLKIKPEVSPRFVICEFETICRQEIFKFVAQLIICFCIAKTLLICRKKNQRALNLEVDSSFGKLQCFDDKIINRRPGRTTQRIYVYPDYDNLFKVF